MSCQKGKDDLAEAGRLLTLAKFALRATALLPDFCHLDMETPSVVYLEVHGDHLPTDTEVHLLLLCMLIEIGDEFLEPGSPVTSIVRPVLLPASTKLGIPRHGAVNGLLSSWLCRRPHKLRAHEQVQPVVLPHRLTETLRGPSTSARTENVQRCTPNPRRTPERKPALLSELNRLMPLDRHSPYAPTDPRPIRSTRQHKPTARGKTPPHLLEAVIHAPEDPDGDERSKATFIMAHFPPISIIPPSIRKAGDGDRAICALCKHCCSTGFPLDLFLMH